MKIELKLLKAKKNTPEGFPLVFEISHKGIRKQKTIGFSKVEHFIDDHKMISSKHPDFEILSPIILDYKIIARKIILSGGSDVEDAFKMMFNFENKVPLFDDFCNQLVSDFKIEIEAAAKRNDLIARNKAAGNLSVYENVIKKFKPYSRKLSIDKLNYSLLIEFRTDLVLDGCSKNTIHLYLRTLRAIYNKAILKYKLHDEKPFNGVFDKLKVKSYDSKKKYILKDDILSLENFVGNKGEREMVDMFLLQFYFGGCDLIDLYFLKKNQVIKDRIVFERGKTNTGLLINLKIHKKAAAILEKYNSDSEFLFPFRKDLDGYKTFRSRYVRLLKKVQDRLNIVILPQGGSLSVKVVRHTFANIGKNLNLEPDLLRELMGHERDDVDNYYKDKFPEKLRDKALFDIIG